MCFLSHQDNKIQVEGVRALSEALKVNTTLTALNLKSVQQQQNKAQQPHRANIDEKNTAVNMIQDEGARALSEALKVNTTLTTLNLACGHEQ